MKTPPRVLFFTLFLLVFFDQLSKFWADKFKLVLVNQGISFGFLGDWKQLKGGGLYTLFLVGLIIFLVGLVFLTKKYKLATTIFMAGAISNLWDRLLFGGVRDWLTIPFFGLKNNLADWFILVGLGMILIQNFGSKREKALRT